MVRVRVRIERGQGTALYTDALAGYLPNLPGARVSRATWVEPAWRPLRLLFRILRYLGGDRGRLAAYTRRWTCQWRIDFSPIGGGVVYTDESGRPFPDRAAAVDYEVRVLGIRYGLAASKEG